MLRLPHELSLDDEHPESYTNVESRSEYNSAINNWSLRLQALEYLIHGNKFLFLYNYATSSIEFYLLLPITRIGYSNIKEICFYPYLFSVIFQVLDNCVELSDILLMTVYLMYRLLCHFEPELLKRQKAAAAGKKYRSADTECDEEMKTWLSILDAFSYICQMSMVDGEGKTRQGAIRYLWRPPEANKGMLR
uniref:DUF3402 domain-containing protein n=1 Tax=Heterorhabditis bacteriophora TaxID=37862 RepID=A0A1I7WLK8_HETBA